MNISPPPHRVCVAPMMDWTDRHCRYFHRLLSKHTWLYTEMVTTGALIYGDVKRHLDFNSEEHPVALQLGGHDPQELVQAGKLAEQWGYDEINLNCGCPSGRVQKGAFGACLMAVPQRVAECVKALLDAVNLPITVKHRIGLDAQDSFEFVTDFVGTVAEAGCKTFFVHARKAILNGLSPKENRVIPPLKYDYAYRLKQIFPELEIVINGGIKTLADIDEHLTHVDGIMIGREAYMNPYVLASFDNRYFDEKTPISSRQVIEKKMFEYASKALAQGIFPKTITRHILGLYRGEPGARTWRRTLMENPTALETC